jgi:hypothetical protein
MGNCLVSTIVWCKCSGAAAGYHPDGRSLTGRGSGARDGGVVGKYATVCSLLL